MSPEERARWLQSTQLDPRREVVVARSPGRLDVVGGIADYSGSLVLELPLACATWIAAQRNEDHIGDGIHIESTNVSGETRQVQVPRSALTPKSPGDEQTVDAAVGNAIEATTGAAWPRYVAGAVHLLATEFDLPRSGWNIAILSSIPEGAGVSSSAALEVAAVVALAAWHRLELSATAVAQLAQRIENHVVGAPCGIMDQMTVAAGRANRLLALRCDPCTVENWIDLSAAGLAALGIDSGVRHSVSGSEYATTRTAAFMGKRMLGIPPHTLLAQSPHGTLQAAAGLPSSILGSEFAARFGTAIGDSESRLLAEIRYPVRAATEFALRENLRAQRLRAIVGRRTDGSSAKTADLGELLRASADGYRSCGLGHPATDRILQQVRHLADDPSSGVVGGRTSGGGCGGTVAVLVFADQMHTATAALTEALDLRTEQVLAGSSDGAVVHGALRLPAGSWG